MINSEEMDAFFNSMDRELEEEKKRQTKFIVALESGLIELAFNYYPEFKDHKTYILNELREELHEGVVMMNELMDRLVRQPC